MFRKTLKTIIFIKLAILFNLFFYSCQDKKYITVFVIDKNVFIPMSYLSKNEIKQDTDLILQKIINTQSNSVKYQDSTLTISLSTLPKIKYEYDSYIYYYSIFLSFFNSFSIEKVDFLYDGKLLILSGIEYSMSYGDYYKYPINDFFNLSDATKGGYYLYSYKASDSNYYLVPILLPLNYDFRFYFNESILKIKNIYPDIDLSTFDKFVEDRYNLSLINYIDKKLSFRTFSLLKFMSFYFNKSKLYFLFYNSQVNKITIHYKFLLFDLSFDINKPDSLYLNKYPINVM